MTPEIQSTIIELAESRPHKGGNMEDGAHSAYEDGRRIGEHNGKRELAIKLAQAFGLNFTRNDTPKRFWEEDDEDE